MLCTEVASASRRITPVPLRASVVIVVMYLYTAVAGAWDRLKWPMARATPGADEKKLEKKDKETREGAVSEGDEQKRTGKGRRGKEIEK